MLKAALDPYVVTVPDESADPNTIRAWVEALSAWALEACDTYCEWYHFLECTHALTQLDRYPGVRSLKRAVQLAGVDIDPVWLARTVNKFFQDESRSLAPRLQTEATVTQSVAISPPEFLARNEAPVRDPLTDTMVCLACDSASGDIGQLGVITLPLRTQAVRVEVAASVALAEPDTRLIRLPDPKSVRAEFPLVTTPDAFIDFAGARAFFSGSAASLERTLRRLAGRTLLRDIRVRDEFLMSVHERGVIQDEAALGKILRIALALMTMEFGNINYHLHEIRSSKAGNSKALVRTTDSATAWRAYVTKRGAGWRLHFWSIPPSSSCGAVVELWGVLAETDPVVIA